MKKYTTFCGGINEDGERNSKKIMKYICRLNISKVYCGEYGMPVLYIGCVVTRG